MIQKIKTTPYFFGKRPESFTKTTIDIFLCGRFEALGDANSNRHLSVYSEVTINTKTKDGGSIGSITGRAGWILGWGMKEDIENITLVVEAKSEGLAKSALPQLLVYMSGVQDAKVSAGKIFSIIISYQDACGNTGKINSYVFGVATDSNDFNFVLLVLIDEFISLVF